MAVVVVQRWGGGGGGMQEAGGRGVNRGSLSVSSLLGIPYRYIIH